MRQRVREAVALMITCGVLGACGAVGEYQGNPAIRGVTLSGRIHAVGPLPKLDPIPVYRDSEVCGELMPSEALLVEGKVSSVEGVVVSLEGVTQGKPMHYDHTIVIESRNCRFVPRVNAAVVGTLLAVQSTDPIMHNTHVRKNGRFGETVLNVLQPAGARGVQKRLTTEGHLDVRCDIHPFMRASIHVFGHPYFTISDSAGKFELTQVPPGTYRLVMWHEILGMQEQPIIVPAEGAVTLEIELGVRRTIR
jgi:hypothetical protein